MFMNELYQLHKYILPTNKSNPLISVLNSYTILGNPSRRLKKKRCRDLNDLNLFRFSKYKKLFI